MTDRRQTPDRRANWVVFLRANEKADWCAYGPGTLREANAFRTNSTGYGMQRTVAQLIPFPKKKTDAAPDAPRCIHGVLKNDFCRICTGSRSL